MEMSEISSVCGACRQVTGPSWLDMSIIIWKAKNQCRACLSSKIHVPYIVIVIVEKHFAR